MAEADSAGMLVRCPGCNTKFQIPSTPPPTTDLPEALPLPDSMLPENAPQQTFTPSKQRKAWKEADPANPNAYLAGGIGLGMTLIWFAIIYFFQAPPDKAAADFTKWESLADLFFKHFTASFANTLFFCWAVMICYLKWQILKHQREAMLLDVLPIELGKEINSQTVGRFIHHVYSLPINLRDSLMVNRIRKALEFFEVRPNVSDVSTLMTSQSAIDGARITSSYIVVRAFLWAIPLIGFIGTVVGLSHAISGMSFNNVEDVSKIVGSINNVTSGLGTAFDATLLGLLFAVLLNFPINTLAKHEEETLNDIDAFCNEVLLPRLNDGITAGKEESLGNVGDAVVRAIANVQKEFLTDLNALSARMLDYANSFESRVQDHQQLISGEFTASMETMRDQVQAFSQNMQERATNLDQRTGAHQQTIMQEFTASMGSMRKQINELSKQMQEHTTALERRTAEYQQTLMQEFVNNMAAQRTQMEKMIGQPLQQTSEYIGCLENGLRSLNKVLQELGEKTIVIQKAKRKWWFGRE